MPLHGSTRSSLAQKLQSWPWRRRTEKANSEAGYAFNAKQAAESHATAIAQIKGTVEADSTWLAGMKKERGRGLCRHLDGKDIRRGARMRAG
jgi:hypothetical protein